MSSLLIAHVSYPNDWRQLKRFITAILKKQLAACIQRINYMKSYYIREWELKRSEEKLLIIKTTANKKEALSQFIHKLHPYDTPEIIRFTPESVNEKYLERACKITS